MIIVVIYFLIIVFLRKCMHMINELYINPYCQIDNIMIN